MGAQIVVKVPKGKNVQNIMTQIRSALQRMGMDNVRFNIQRVGSAQMNRLTKSPEIDSSTIRLL